MMPSGETAMAAVLIIPAIATLLLAVISSYQAGATINVVATALTLCASSLLVAVRPGKIGRASCRERVSECV